MHLPGPVPEAVDNEFPHGTVGAVQGVPSPGVVRVRMVGIVGGHVIGAVVDGLEAESGAGLVTLSCVVVHHVEEDLDARLVQGLHHLAKLLNRLPTCASCGVLVVWRKEVQRHVAPIVRLGSVELVHRHQLDGCDAELLQVGDLLNHSCKRPSLVGANRGVGVHGESLDVHLVDNQIAVMAWALILTPVKGWFFAG